MNMINDLEYRNFTKPAELDKAIHTLSGILEGITIDKKINSDEMTELINWCSLHRHLIDRHPFSEIIPMIDAALEDGELTEDEMLDIAYVCHNFSQDSEYYDLITSSIQELQGIFHGIMADNAVLDNEITSLNEWVLEHDFLISTYPYDEIKTLLTDILRDGKITEEERNILKVFFANFIDLKISYNVSEKEIDDLRKNYSTDGICSTSPKIEVKGKTFCFTGTSKKASRKEIAADIQIHGGVFASSVTQKTDYLIVGNEGNPCWAFSCYGRKVEKAVELRKKGSNIQIINEDDFWNALAL